MTRKQIDILIKHGDISSKSYSGANFCDWDEYSFHANDGIDYCISKEMYSIFYSLFEHNEPLFSGFDKTEFDKTISVNIGIRPPNKESKLKALTDLLEIEIANLKKLTGNLTYYNTPDTLKELWFFDFFKQGENIVECLKFEILEGKKLSEFKLPYEKELPNRYKLDSYFNTVEMSKIYEVGEINKTIDYLQKLITEFEIPINNKVKRKPVSDRLLAIKILLEYKSKVGYNHYKMRPVDVDNLHPGGVKKHLYELRYFGKDNTTTKYKPYTYDELKMVRDLNLLDGNEDAQKLLKNEIYNLR